MSTQVECILGSSTYRPTQYYRRLKLQVITLNAVKFTMSTNMVELPSSLWHRSQDNLTLTPRPLPWTDYGICPSDGIPSILGTPAAPLA